MVAYTAVLLGHATALLVHAAALLAHVVAGCWFTFLGQLLMSHVLLCFSDLHLFLVGTFLVIGWAFADSTVSVDSSLVWCHRIRIYLGLYSSWPKG
ncbi:hypothetical protein VNO78_21658 [Psophocarpus tetragonolobus]|uniref:Uncharacterized protein n=1 Tax=Psophocarpus tetragonolobus TaxID=3891 RepID=A0AAN9SCN4_PSOTE